MSEVINTERTTKIVCPYCGAVEPYMRAYDTSKGEYTCRKCFRTSDLDVHINLLYTTKKQETEQ